LLHGTNWPTDLLARAIDGTVSVFARPSWANISLIAALLLAASVPAALRRRSLCLGLLGLAGVLCIVFAGQGWATLPVSPPSWAEVALIAALLLTASMPAVVRRRSLCLSLLTLAGGVFAIALLRPAAPVGAPILTFIDVGQGDGCLIRLPGGYNLLVDGGGSPRAPCEQRDCSDAPVGHLADSIRKDCTDIGRDILASYLRHERVRRVDLMVLTHPHDDHLWGLDALLDPRQRFDIGAVLDAGQHFDSPANREWLALLRQRHLTPMDARRGMELTVGPARLVVLHPPGVFLSHTRNDPNHNSIVLRLEVAGMRVLLTGDAEAEAEASMAGQDVAADVVKVGHHGSAYSTSDAWLERVRPRMAVISCGRHNSFGHPSAATLQRLREHGVQVYRTDQDGAVTLEFGPSGWTATTMVPTAR
jgi:competence protein ComEC